MINHVKKEDIVNIVLHSKKELGIMIGQRHVNVAKVHVNDVANIVTHTLLVVNRFAVSAELNWTVL